MKTAPPTTTTKSKAKSTSRSKPGSESDPESTPEPGDEQPARWRRILTDEVITGVVATMVVATAAGLMVPVLGRAGTPDDVDPFSVDDRDLLSEYQRLALEGLDLAIASAHATVAVIEDDHLQLVMWTSDADSDGLIDAHELLVLDHSPYLASISACFLQQASVPEIPDGAPAKEWHIRGSLMSHPDAMAVFLGHRDAVRHVLARSVVGARVIGGPPGASGAVTDSSGVSRRIELTWNAETDDTTLTTFVPTPLPDFISGP